MPTLTINMSEELRQQLDEAIKDIRLTAEDFILLAIANKLEQSCPTDDDNVHADISYANYLRSGESVPLDEVMEYFEARLAGKDVKKPAFRKTKA